MKKTYCQFFIQNFFHEIIVLLEMKSWSNDFEILKFIIQYHIFDSRIDMLFSNFDNNFSQHKLLLIEKKNKSNQWLSFVERKNFLNLNDNVAFIFTNETKITIYFIHLINVSFIAIMIKTEKKTKSKKLKKKVMSILFWNDSDEWNSTVKMSYFRKKIVKFCYVNVHFLTILLRK